MKQLKVNSIGGVIKPGEDIIEIVPADDKLLIEAKVRPADIAFIHPGQKAIVKITAYDFSIYGGLEGVVQEISADTIQDQTNNKRRKFFTASKSAPIKPSSNIAAKSCRSFRA